MVSGGNSSHWEREFSRLLMHLKLFGFPISTIDLCVIVLRSESYKWPQVHSLTPLS